MKEHRVCWILAYLFVLAAVIPTLGQAPSSPVMNQPAAPEQRVPETRIKARVSLVNTPVTVVNSKGELVSDLEAKDFKVADNGVPQKITHFDLGRPPLSLVILIETSSRIESLLPEIRRTGIVFTNTVMGPEDEAAVVGFNDSVDDLEGFTADHDRIQNTFNTLKAGSEGSRLFDAMTMALEMLSRLRPQPTSDSPERQRVMLIMSEGIDAGSDMRLGRVLWQAQRSNVSIYSVGISTALAAWKAPPKEVRPHLTPQGIFPQPGMPGTVQIPETEATRYGYGNLLNFLPNIKNQFANPLEIAASGTGGQFIATFKGKSMEEAVDQIGAELHGQYSLTYEHMGTSETGYHEIKVHVDRKGLKVRARPGYYVAPPEI
jgi:VWFA-related protein